MMLCLQGHKYKKTHTLLSVYFFGDPNGLDATIYLTNLHFHLPVMCNGASAFERPYIFSITIVYSSPDLSLASFRERLSNTLPSLIVPLSPSSAETLVLMISLLLLSIKSSFRLCKSSYTY